MVTIPNPTALAHANRMKRTVEILQERGIEASYRSGYSGRGMFGGVVPAIVTSASLGRVAVAYAMACVEQGAGDDEFLVDDALDLAWEQAPQRWDNMGRDNFVFY